ncbi:MAG: serine/threonine protein kinase [Oscillospiraceae bacterium]|nr:serine/threonine protein kinase [Oscillospiraceae bacterium]
MKTPVFTDALPVGTQLNEFEIRSVIGEGGFSVVYLAYDTKLLREVAIKEYLPKSLALRHDKLQVIARASAEKTFEQGMRHFVKETRVLAKLRHFALATVFQFFEANGTAYLVMPYYHGKTLQEMIGDGYLIRNTREFMSIFLPLLDGLSLIHAMGCYHLDISADNIIVLRNRTPVLLDFGSSHVVQLCKDNASTIILKHGYAPIEQYCSGNDELKLGPWSDIYALSAVMRQLITGKLPLTAPSRVMNDTLQPLADLGISHLPVDALKAIDTGLAVRQEDRPQTAKAFYRTLKSFDSSRIPYAAKLSNKTTADSVDVSDESLKNSTKKVDDVDVFQTSRSSKLLLCKRFVTDFRNRIPAKKDQPINRNREKQSYTSIFTTYHKFSISAGIVVFALLLLTYSYYLSYEVTDNLPLNENVSSSSNKEVNERAELQLSSFRSRKNELSRNVIIHSDSATSTVYEDLPEDVAADVPDSPTIADNIVLTNNNVSNTNKKNVDTARSESEANVNRETSVSREGRDASVGKASHGQIEITVRPWGHVSLNGRHVGTTPPRLVLSASEGRHKIVISNESNESCVLEVEVNKGKRVVISHDFLAETPPAVLGPIAADIRR